MIGVDVVDVVIEKDPGGCGCGAPQAECRVFRCITEAEVGAFVFPNNGEPDFPFFNFGFDYTINKNVHFLGSAGRGFRSSSDGTPDFFCLLGFQYLFGKAAEEEDPSHEEGAGGGGGGVSDEASTPEFLREPTTRAASRDFQRTLINPAAY